MGRKSAAAARPGGEGANPSPVTVPSPLSSATPGPPSARLLLASSTHYINQHSVTNQGGTGRAAGESKPARVPFPSEAVEINRTPATIVGVSFRELEPVRLGKLKEKTGR